MSGAKKSKRAYRKSTPIGRLRRNVDKVQQHAELLRSRVSSWNSSDERVLGVEKLAGAVVARSREADGLLAELEDSGFAPPEKQRSVAWVEGQKVAVGAKFRPKYEAAFRENLERDSGFLDLLVVDNVLPSGEVVVRRKGKSPFLVPKTHLVEAPAEGSGGST